jgi:uncharacterized protein (DUF2062 family)
MRRFIIHSLLHADDPPQRLALGVAIAMFVTFTPTIGFQMVLAICLAWIFRANKAVGIPIVWISNPATAAPIYYLCYRIGLAILRQPGVGGEWWSELAHPPSGWWAHVTFFWDRFMEIAAPLWTGSLVLAFAIGYVSYYISYYAIYGYRMKRWGQLIPPANPRKSKRVKASHLHQHARPR